MPLSSCPQCGRSAPDKATACPNCGHALANGIVPRENSPRQKPPPPPEVSDWIIYPTPPEILEEMRRTFNEDEFLAKLRAVERTGDRLAATTPVREDGAGAKHYGGEGKC